MWAFGQVTLAVCLFATAIAKTPATAIAVIGGFGIPWAVSFDHFHFFCDPSLFEYMHDGSDT